MNNIYKEKKLGLYIHVPFCYRKCPYCSFYSLPFTAELVNLYVEALTKKIFVFSEKIRKYRYVVDTVYIGGGTPSTLDKKDLFKIFSSIKRNFILKNPEVTLEVNPSSVNSIDFNFLKQLGINRISVGVQSANNHELKLLGRLHTHCQNVEVMNLAKKAGFNNISVDIMFNIPGQSKKSLLNSLNFCLKAGVQHVSAYMLKIEKGTLFHEKLNSLNLPNERDQCDFYLYVCNTLEKLGFKQYEISNFAKSGFESRHNLKYWNLDEYLGIGPSAHSFLGSKRFYYENSLKSFLTGKKPIYEINTKNNNSLSLSLEEEYVMLKLRLASGLKNSEYFEKFKKNVPEKYFTKALFYEKLGFLEVKNKDYIKLKVKGYLVSNKLIADVLF